MSGKRTTVASTLAAVMMSVRSPMAGDGTSQLPVPVEHAQAVILYFYAVFHAMLVRVAQLFENGKPFPRHGLLQPGLIIWGT